MDYPAFMQAFPGLVVPLPDDQVRIHAIRSDAGLVVFFDFLKDTALPPHSHKGQWGTVIAGQITLTIDGTTRICRPGDSYDIPAGAVHSALVMAGTKAMDVFEEPDRYPLRWDKS
jgi:quercetin dioxygenase-like cupin family protein